MARQQDTATLIATILAAVQATQSKPNYRRNGPVELVTGSRKTARSQTLSGAGTRGADAESAPPRRAESGNSKGRGSRQPRRQYTQEQTDIYWATKNAQLRKDFPDVARCLRSINALFSTYRAPGDGGCRMQDWTTLRRFRDAANRGNMVYCRPVVGLVESILSDKGYQALIRGEIRQHPEKYDYRPSASRQHAADESAESARTTARHAALAAIAAMKGTGQQAAPGETVDVDTLTDAILKDMAGNVHPSSDELTTARAAKTAALRADSARSESASRAEHTRLSGAAEAKPPKPPRVTMASLLAQLAQQQATIDALLAQQQQQQQQQPTPKMSARKTRKLARESEPESTIAVESESAVS